VKLGSVLTDIFGVTGRMIQLALLDGKLTTSEMAHLAKRSAKLKIPSITPYLENHHLTETQRLLIRQSFR
jgi:hypothetical protein